MQVPRSDKLAVPLVVERLEYDLLLHSMTDPELDVKQHVSTGGSFRNTSRCALEFKRMQLESDRKNSCRYPLGTYYPNHLPAGLLHVRRDVFRSESVRRRNGLAYFDTETLFDHDRLRQFIDSPCTVRGGLLDSFVIPTSIWEPYEPTGISPIWVCNKMRFISRSDIVRRHSRSSSMRALASNTKPLGSFPRLLLTKTFPIHKFVPMQWDVAGIIPALPTPLLSASSDVTQTTLSQIGVHGPVDIGLLDSTSFVSSSGEIGQDRSLSEMPKNVSDKKDGVSMDDVRSSKATQLTRRQMSSGRLDPQISDVKASTESPPRSRRGRIAGLKTSQWLQNAVVHNMGRLVVGQPKSLNSRQSQLRSRWLLETTKKSMRLVRHQLNEEYLDALRYLYRTCVISGSIQSIREMLWYLGSPETRVSTIIVTGSFGKTIVASKVAAALSHVGFKVGLFTSPHLVTIRERISINGSSLISKSEVVHLVNCIRKAAEATATMPTFFEIITLMAFCHFRNHGCDYIVLESGSAGAADPVNCTSQVVCSVITGVAVGMEIYGTSRYDVARSYMGYLRPHAVLVLGPTAMQFPFFKERAESLESPFVEVGPEPNEDFDTENSRIAAAVLSNMNLPMSEYQFNPGLGARPLFRFHRLTHRDRAIAARHVHYFLKCAYNMTRAMHMQWRAIAVTHPELFTSLRCNAEGQVDVSKKKIAKWDEIQKAALETANVAEASRMPTPQMVPPPPLRHAPSDLARAFDEVGRQSLRVSSFRNPAPVIISRAPTGLLVQRPLRSSSFNLDEGQRDLAIQNTADYIVPQQTRHNFDCIESADLPRLRHFGSEVQGWTKQSFETDSSKQFSVLKTTRDIWLARKYRGIRASQGCDIISPVKTDQLLGARLFLTYCTVATESWPTHYSERLPFKNWTSEYRRWNNTEITERIDRVEEEQDWRLSHIHNIDNCAYGMTRLLSFLHFVAFRNEFLYWNFAELIQLRESGSPYIRPLNWLQQRFPSMPQSLTAFGRIPAIARIVGTALKARIRRDEIYKLLVPAHSILPSPHAIVIDTPPNAHAFGRLFSQLREYFPTRSIRVCVALDGEQRVNVLNSVIPIFNHNSRDSNRSRTEIKGIHILEPEHFRAKRISSYLWEMATDVSIDPALKVLLASSLITQLHWQLCVLPPLSPIPLDVFQFLQSLSVEQLTPKFEMKETAEIEKLKQRILLAAEARWPGDPGKAKRNLRVIIQSNPRFSHIPEFFKDPEEKKERKTYPTASKNLRRGILVSQDRRIIRDRQNNSRISLSLNEYMRIEGARRLTSSLSPWRLFESSTSHPPVKSKKDRPKLYQMTAFKDGRLNLRRPHRVIEVISLSMILRMCKESAIAESISETFGDEHQLVGRRSRRGGWVEDDETINGDVLEDTFPLNYDSPTSSVDSIKSDSLRNLLFSQRQKLLKSDPYDQISCLTDQIDLEYSIDRKPLEFNRQVPADPRPHLGQIDKWKFEITEDKARRRSRPTDLFPPTRKNLLDMLRIFTALKAPEHVLFQFANLWRGYHRLEVRTRRLQRAQFPFDYPSPILEFQNRADGVGSVLPKGNESLFGNIPIVRFRSKRSTGNKERKLGQSNLEVVGQVQVDEPARIKNTSISINGITLKSGTFNATFVELNKLLGKKELVKRRQNFIFLPTTVAKSTACFALTGYWDSFPAPKVLPRKMKSNMIPSDDAVVAIPASTFRRLVSDGAWIRLMHGAEDISNISRSAKAFILSQRARLYRRVDGQRRPLDWDDEELNDPKVKQDETREAYKKRVEFETEESKEKNILNISLLLRSTPSRLRRMAQSLASEGTDRRKNKKNPEISTELISQCWSERADSSESRDWMDKSEVPAGKIYLTEENKKSKNLGFNCNRVLRQFRELLEHLRIKTLAIDDEEEVEFYKRMGVDFQRFSHMFKPNKKNSGIETPFVDVIQPGDLQSQLSMIFQKSASEQSVLLICGSPLMAREVMLTLGCGISPSSKSDPIVCSPPCVTEDVIRGWQSIDPEAFPCGYVTISPSAMARRAGNAYLADARRTRQENERTRQSEIIRYRNEQQHRV